MTETLQQLTTEPTRAAVVAALVADIEAAARDTAGLSGTAIKTGLAAVRKVNPEVVGKAVDKLLPRFVAALDPLWADYRGDARGAADFGAYLAGRPEEAAEALLSVTDAQAASAKPVIAKGYGRLRGGAQKHVIAALPRVGRTIENHALG